MPPYVNNDWVISTSITFKGHLTSENNGFLHNQSNTLPNIGLLKPQNNLLRHMKTKIKVLVYDKSLQIITDIKSSFYENKN